MKKIKEQLEIVRFRMNLRKSFKKSSILELEITLDELQKELTKRQKNDK